MPIICRLPGRENLKVLASAIGEPAAPKDKKERLAEIIDNAQKDIASLCNEKGCNIPAHPTFPDIISGLNKVTHFLQSAQISGLSAQVGFSEPGKMVLSWKNPISDQNYSGVMIRYKAGSYPVSQTDGTLIYDSNGTLPASETVTVTGLSDGTSYYVRGFACAISGASRIYTTSTTGAQCTAIPRQLKGQTAVTSSGVFTVPYGVSKIDIFLVGGGASGASRTGGISGGCVGGGAGYTKTIKSISVTSGQQFSVVIGAGGAVYTGEKWNMAGNSGSLTSFGNYAVDGGVAYNYKTETDGRGGSGGGHHGGNGGSDGTAGRYLHGAFYDYSPGQGTTTRAFGESTNTLYAGGGGGGSYYEDNFSYTGGIGGNGGGGNGHRYGDFSHPGYEPVSGTPNTGGGGGGSKGTNSTDGAYYGAAGGSGIVIVRWGY